MKKLLLLKISFSKENVLNNSEKKQITGGGPGGPGDPNSPGCSELIKCDCGALAEGVIWVPRGQGCPKGPYGLERCINFDDNPMACPSGGGIIF